MKSYPLVLALLAVALCATFVSGNIVVTNLNTTVALNTNGSAQVTEITTISISNLSVAQYTADRLALNLTVSQWQNLIGPSLVEHIVSARGITSNFRFLPGPANNSQNGKTAELLLSYSVTNVTRYNETGPRTFLYSFNNGVFNFQHAESGQVLGENTTLTVVLPQGAKIASVYPLPDSPSFPVGTGFGNSTRLSWSADEPLSKFTLTFTVQESLEQEVAGFFNSIYKYYGGLLLVLGIGVIAFFITYTYLRTAK
jgi:hypothetical protein